MTEVKVCGITNTDDALMAADAGASVLGFIFFPESGRHVEPAAAAAIARELPPGVMKAGVFVNQDIDFVRRAVDEAGLDIVQVHGDETPQFCRKIPGKYMRAVRVRGSESLAQVDMYDSEFVLLDTFSERRFGGTGESFDWGLLRGFDLGGRRLFLSGGLNPGNVADAVRAVRPYAVDVCSGVEKKTGIKDPDKVKRFMEEVRFADGER